MTSAPLRNPGPGFWPSYLIAPSFVPWKWAYWNSWWEENYIQCDELPQSPQQRTEPRVCQSYWGFPERLTLRTSRTVHRGTEGRWGRTPWGRLWQTRCSDVLLTLCVCVAVTFWRVCPPLCWSEAGKWELHRCWSLPLHCIYYVMSLYYYINSLQKISEESI